MRPAKRQPKAAAKPEPRLLEQWRRTQSAWDDHEFLERQANAFMKLRWRRLNARAAKAVDDQAQRLMRPVALLDVGAAHADFFDWCAPSLGTYTGLEPSKALLPRNVTRGGEFRLVRGQAEALPFPPGSFDFVLVKEVLDHCWGPDRVLAEAHRVLRPGGRCLVTLTNDRAWYKLLLPARAAAVKAGQHDHLFYFHPGQVRGLFGRAGFRRVDGSDSHYLRLPYALEGSLGGLPEPLGRALIDATDAVGELLLPGLGGSFWVWGDKD